MAGAALPRVLRTRAELRAALAAAPRPIGLVPTMGALHDGHASLIRRARAENATVLVTIFVNPRQFNEAADFEKYPRDEAADLRACRRRRRRPGLDPAGRGGLPGRLPDERARRRPDRAAGRRGAAGPLRGRDDGRGDPARAGRRRAGLLRPEGRPAAAGRPAHGPGPGHRHGDRGLPDRARARRPGAELAQRAADPRAAGGRAGSATGAAGRPRPLRRRASATARRSGRRCGRCSRPSRWPRPNT